MKIMRVRVPCLKRGKDYFITTPQALAQALAGEGVEVAAEYHGLRVGQATLRRLVKDLVGPDWLLKVTANGRLEVKTFWPRRPTKMPSCFFGVEGGAWLKYKEPERVSLLVPRRDKAA